MFISVGLCGKFWSFFSSTWRYFLYVLSVLNLFITYTMKIKSVFWECVSWFLKVVKIWQIWWLVWQIIYGPNYSYDNCRVGRIEPRTESIGLQLLQQSIHTCMVDVHLFPISKLQYNEKKTHKKTQVNLISSEVKCQRRHCTLVHVYCCKLICLLHCPQKVATTTSPRSKVAPSHTHSPLLKSRPLHLFSHGIPASRSIRQFT